MSARRAAARMLSWPDEWNRRRLQILFVVAVAVMAAVVGGIVIQVAAAWLPWTAALLGNAAIPTELWALAFGAAFLVWALAEALSQLAWRERDRAAL